MRLKKLQEGGMMPQDQGVAQGGGPEEQLAQMAAQIIEQLGPEAAAMLTQMLAQMLQEMQGGAGGQMEEAPPQGEPVYAKKGGKLVMLGRR